MGVILNNHINELLAIDHMPYNTRPFVRQVKEFHLGQDIIRYHQFIVPNITNGGYRPITSLNAFFYGMKKYNHTPNGIIYMMMDPEFYPSIPNDRNNVYMGPFQIFQHETIWNFYNFIGWNWKKKKWTTVN